LRDAAYAVEGGCIEWWADAAKFHPHPI